MSIVAALGPTLTIIGTLLVGGGLLRRDPEAQRSLRRGWARIRSRLRRLLRLRGRPQTIKVELASESTIASSLEVARRPASRRPDTSIDARLDWLERAVDILVDELDRERDVRSRGDSQVGKRVTAAEKQLSDDVRELARRIDQVRVPERMEWWGLPFLIVGAGLSTFAG